MARWRNVGGVGGAAVVAAQGMKMFCTKTSILQGVQMAAMTIVCRPECFRGQILVDPTSKENHPLVPIQQRMNLKRKATHGKKKIQLTKPLGRKKSYCHIEETLIFAKRRGNRSHSSDLKARVPTNWLNQ